MHSTAQSNAESEGDSTLIDSSLNLETADSSHNNSADSSLGSSVLSEEASTPSQYSTELGGKKRVSPAPATPGICAPAKAREESISEITTGYSNLSINTSSVISPISLLSTDSGLLSAKPSSDTDTSSCTSSKCLPTTPAGSPEYHVSNHTPLSSPPTSSSECLSPLRSSALRAGVNGHGAGVPSGGVSFASLSSERPQAVAVPWAETPNNFVVSLL